jgi:hypothetical protein
MIAGIGVQPLFQGARGQPQSLPPRGCFQRFKVQVSDRLAA